jgi:hypothetical protein
LIPPASFVLNSMKAAIPVLLLLASCAPRTPGRPSDGPGVSGELSIISFLDPASRDPIEGGLGLFSVSVRNASKKYVILRDLALADGTPILGWVNPPTRSLAYDPQAGEFRAESGPRAAGEVVHIGLLLPGETINFRPQVRLLGLPKKYVLTYYSYSLDQLAQVVYFEVEGGGPLRFRRRVAADIQAIPAMRETAATHRSVIFPSSNSPSETPSTAEVVLDVETPPRRFRLADALRKASIPPADVLESTYCDYLDGWAVRSVAGSKLVTPMAVTALPNITRFELCFFHLDSIETHLPAQFEFTGALDVRFPGRDIRPLRDKGRTRKLAFIERSRLAGFLAEVDEKALEIEIRAEGQSISMVLRSAAHERVPTISLEDALKRAGIGRGEVLEDWWSDALGAWALRTRVKSWQVSERGLGPLPEINWFAWFFEKADDLCAAGRDVRFAIPAEHADAFPYAVGGAVKKADLAKFLVRAHELGLSVEVTPERGGSFRLMK